MKPSDILSTIVLIAIGMILRKSNLKIAIMVNSSKMVNAIEFDKNGKSIKLKVKIIFTVKGTE